MDNKHFKKQCKIRAKMAARNGVPSATVPEETTDANSGDEDLADATATATPFNPCCRKGRVLARFVKHVTIPDHTPVVCGTTFSKTWRVRNDSDASWPTNCELVPVGGETGALLVSTEGTPVRGSVQPGCEADITVTLIAPEKPGFVQGFWRLRDVDSNKKFGQRLWVSVLATQSSSDEEDFVAVTAADNDLDEDPAVATAARQLQDMGFTDSALNHRLLQRYRGNVERAVEHLSNSQ